MRLPIGIRNLLKVITGLSVGVILGYVFTAAVGKLFKLINLNELL